MSDDELSAWLILACLVGLVVCVVGFIVFAVLAVTGN